MAGGFGDSIWGDGPWGGSIVGYNLAQSEGETLTLIESLDIAFPLKVDSAQSLLPNLVRVNFNSPLDPSVSADLDPSSYIIPGLQVSTAFIHPTNPTTILLATSEQIASPYTVTVSTAVRSLSGDFLSSDHASVTFLGYAQAPAFTAQPQSAVKVRLTFTAPMDQGVELTDPTNYLVRSLDGSTVPVTGAVIVGVASKQVELTLGSSLASGYYALQISTNVKTQDGRALNPHTDLFQWLLHIPDPIRIKFDDFSGEVRGGPHGQPEGQVFFSPAYGSPIANSIIQIESISVCTKAFDSYVMPSGGSTSSTLYTWPPPVGPHVGSELGSYSLFATPEYLGLARVELHDLREDILPSISDSDAVATLAETVDISRASFLNDTRWETFPAVTASLGVFSTADNATYIGGGPTTIIPLQ